MGVINNDCNGKAEKVTLRILQEWLERKGLPVTWPTLVQTLRDTELSTLAQTRQRPLFLISHTHHSDDKESR